MVGFSRCCPHLSHVGPGEVRIKIAATALCHTVRKQGDIGRKVSVWVAWHKGVPVWHGISPTSLRHLNAHHHMQHPCLLHPVLLTAIYFPSLPHCPPTPTPHSCGGRRSTSLTHHLTHHYTHPCSMPHAPCRTRTPWMAWTLRVGVRE